MRRLARSAAVAARSTAPSRQPRTPAPATEFNPRQSFSFPTSVPSWYIGHMHRAMRALPSMLARHPPPLIVEVRDARLALTSINPRFEELLQRAPSAGEHVRVDGSVQPGWAARRLIVYTKADLIDESLRAPLLNAVRENTVGHSVMIVDTRLPRDVRRVYDWVTQRAAALARAAVNPTGGRSQRASQLTGAARHSPTPDTGVRLVVIGMPNVGKSSLLNRLRFVGTGKGSAASTHPHPGHTRKVTGTVRITPALPSLGELEASGPVDMKRLVAERARQPPAVYVYDTPGIMVPYLGANVRDGPERALKLAVIGCLKQAQLDSDELVDYLLFRMNQKYMANLKHGITEPPPYTTLMRDPKMTDDCIEFLNSVAPRAPGAKQQKGEPNLLQVADYVLDMFRKGRLGTQELDLSVESRSAGQSIAEAVRAHVASHVTTEHCDTALASQEHE